MKGDGYAITPTENISQFAGERGKICVMNSRRGWVKSKKGHAM